MGDELLAAVKDTMSPEAVVLVISRLKGAECNDDKVTGEVKWLDGYLMAAIGEEQYNEICAALDVIP